MARYGAMRFGLALAASLAVIAMAPIATAPPAAAAEMLTLSTPHAVANAAYDFGNAITTIRVASFATVDAVTFDRAPALRLHPLATVARDARSFARFDVAAGRRSSRQPIKSAG